MQVNMPAEMLTIVVVRTETVRGGPLQQLGRPIHTHTHTLDRCQRLPRRSPGGAREELVGEGEEEGKKGRNRVKKEGGAGIDARSRSRDDRHLEVHILQRHSTRYRRAAVVSAGEE